MSKMKRPPPPARQTVDGIDVGPGDIVWRVFRGTAKKLKLERYDLFDLSWGIGTKYAVQRNALLAALKEADREVRLATAALVRAQRQVQRVTQQLLDASQVAMTPGVRDGGRGD